LRANDTEGIQPLKSYAIPPGGLKEKEDPEELANPIRTLTATYYDCYYYL